MVKIAIIKLGAKGDVVRTLSILPALKEKYPNSEITWVTKENIVDLLEGNDLVDVLKTIPCDDLSAFDIVFNFDIEKEATDLVSKIDAGEKYGFYSEGGYPAAFNLGAEYYLNTMFDDDLKKSNKKTYQQMMFEAADMVFSNQSAEILLSEKDKDFGKLFIESNGLSNKKIVGIHMGAGPRWPSKAWAEGKVRECIRGLSKKGYEVILFGGPDEQGRHGELVAQLQKENVAVSQNNPSNSNREFAALVDRCDGVICSDSFALHVALGLKKKTIGLFFCTSPNEIEGYGLLHKLVSPQLSEFFPEKMDQFSEELVNSISVDEVLKFL